MLRVHRGIVQAARLAPGQKRDLSKSESGICIHTCSVRHGGKQGCRRKGEAEADGKKPEGNQCWLVSPPFRLRKRTRAQLPTSMPWAAARQQIWVVSCLVWVFLRRCMEFCCCSVSCPFSFFFPPFFFFFGKKKDVESDL